ncbi:piggyBac transposable element-derived protein 4-like [Vespula maculifrons]|uniref:PiggyBac transposable element-derived protein 4-like n=1 Tax=Vespula maculifrons TaxID=7453 RepID=A0ABD2BHY2_VESMC
MKSWSTDKSKLTIGQQINLGFLTLSKYLGETDFHKYFGCFKRYAKHQTQRISNFLEYINNKCRENFVFEVILSVDERLLNSKGE